MQKNVFNKEDYEEIVFRINKLTPQTRPLWGKMNVAQMLSHCTAVQDVLNGKQLKGTPWYIKLFGRVIKKSVIGVPPYKKNLPTHPQYVRVSEENFEASKAKLLAAIAKILTLSDEEIEGNKHALFGKMTKQEKGVACYKHNDHHLKQFGV